MQNDSKKKNILKNCLSSRLSFISKQRSSKAGVSRGGGVASSFTKTVEFEEIYDFNLFNRFNRTVVRE